MTRPARRAISELLAEDIAAAALEFITGPLLEAPYRVGKPLRDTLSGFHSARLGTQRRVLYRIDESKHAVIVQDIQRRSCAAPAETRSCRAVSRPGAARCVRRGRGCLGEPGVEPSPDLLWRDGAAVPVVPCDHDPGGRDAAFGSNVFIQTSTLPGWLQAWVRVNPVTASRRQGA